MPQRRADNPKNILWQTDYEKWRREAKIEEDWCPCDGCYSPSRIDDLYTEDWWIDWHDGHDYDAYFLGQDR